MKRLSCSLSSKTFCRFSTVQKPHSSLAPLRTTTVRKFTISHRGYARKTTPYHRHQKNIIQGQERHGVSASHIGSPEVEVTESTAFDNHEAEEEEEEEETFVNVTEEQKTFWLSDGFSSLCTKYPAIKMHIQVPPGPPVTGAEDRINDMAMALAVHINVQKYPPDVLETGETQAEFTESMMSLVIDHIDTIMEGLKVGWLAPVDERKSGVSVFESDE